MPDIYTIFTRPISGSLGVTGSIYIPTDQRLFGTASFAISSSFSTTSSFATSASFAPYGGLRTKSNAIANTSFTGNPKKATVTFTTAFPNTSYAVTITGEDARSWTIESKLAGSFVINANSNTNLAGTTYWIATAYGET